MSIFCIGQAVYDITVQLNTPLVGNTKYRIYGWHGCAGAPALNAACLCGLWGAPTQLMARVGDDAYGAEVRKSLEAFHVSTDYLLPSRPSGTPFSFIAVERATGARTIFNVAGDKAAGSTSAEAQRAEEEAALKAVPAERPDVILADGHEPEVSLAVMKAYPDVPSVLDAGGYHFDVLKVAQAVDYLVCSEDFAKAHIGEQINPDDPVAADWALRRIEEINHKHAVITLGERGLLYRDENGKPCQLPAFPAQAVDTTGAGDVFHGAFTWGVYKGLPLRENLRHASMASSISVRRIGGQTSIPTLDEVESELARVDAARAE